MATVAKKLHRIIGLKELREIMGTYISKVEKGKSFTVVRRSRPVFRLMPVDEWGDEGTWETVLDFRKEGGIPIKKLIKALERSIAKDKSR